MAFKHTRKQDEAIQLLGSDSRHILLRGGARSGKTVVLTEALLARALLAPKSRHAILRFRANSLKSITGPTGTLFYVMDNCFPPGVRERSTFNKQDGFLQLPNDAEVWFGGLDDKERAEKILGNEYATIYINEASQVPWASYNIAMTRLAQTVLKEDGTPLRQKAYLDANPPPETHWLHRLFEEKKDPETRRPLVDPMAYNSMLINPEDNRTNLDPAYLDSLSNLPERQRKRFYLGQYGDAGEAALWTSELLDQQRILDATRLPQFTRIVVAVDPSGADDVEDTAADEIGIGVVALGTDGNAYVLEDLTMRGSPAEWGHAVVAAYERHGADRVVGEENFGGAMVRHVVMSDASSHKTDLNSAAERGRNIVLAYRSVTASRGKHVRAEPAAALYEQRKVWHVGRFPDLEDEMTAMTTAGYTGSKSPNRADWLVWALAELFPSIVLQAKQNAIGGSLAQRPAPKVNLGHGKAKMRMGRR